MKHRLRILAEYKLFLLAVLTIVVGLILEIVKQHTIANILLAVVAIAEVLPVLWNMWQDIRAGTYGIDVLAATAIIASVILGQYWAAIVVVVMLTGGEGLENFAEHRARGELDALLKHAPQTTYVLRKGKTVEVPVSELQVGDKVVIKAGELVPVDAVIIEGTASFDESSLTGESLPQAKQKNDRLMSGSINLDGPITAKVTASAEDSQYQQIIKLVRGAAANRAPFVRLADRYSIPFTFIAYAIALGMWAVSGQAIRFLEVIVVATPCPLLLAAPIALMSGMARASRYGIIVKTGSALERLAETRTMAFDKTGTLTRGELSVDAVFTTNAFTPAEVLALAASLEQGSTHVVATAITNNAKSKGLKLSKAKHIQEIAGRGLEATLKGRHILLGRRSLIEERGAVIPKSLQRRQVNQTAVYVAIDDQLAGIITLKDELRPEAKDTLELLRQLGIYETMMVTGDNQTTAKIVAKQLGINHVHAEALPADKIHILEEVQLRPLAFVGDGVNDAPILTAADVGIALGARGVAAASESADMVIMPDDLSRVAGAVVIAKRTFFIARQSILIGIGLSVFLMIVFATGAYTPLAGAIVQEVVDVLVIFNALRAHSITIRTAGA